MQGVFFFFFFNKKILLQAEYQTNFDTLPVNV
jgi:hypothetical protein